MNNYDDSSIRSLKGAERVRERVNVMFGSNNIDGAFHTVKEIIGNSLDECRAGFGKEVIVHYYEDGSISVRDFGRGVPLGWNEAEQRWNWDLVFNELYAGGKYDDNSTNYKFSIGLNGLGGASVQYTSEYFDVISYNGGSKSSMHFERGNPVGDLKVEQNNDNEVGTYIHWKIDNEVFPDTDFKSATFKEYCETQAYLNNIVIHYINDKTDEDIKYEGGGIEALIKSKLKDNVVETFREVNSTKGVNIQNKAYTAECEIIFAITEENSRPVKMFFHNTSTMRDVSGMHQRAFNDAVNEFFRGISNSKGVKIQESDYREYISCIISSYSSITSFYNQTKDAVSDYFIYDMINDGVKKILDIAYAKGNSSLMSLIDNVVVAAQARIKAKQIEQAERKAKKATNSRRKAEKFKDCAEKNPDKRELYIVEGDSALGACKLARDSKFQALIPVQGKILNCLKASIEKILENKIISDLTSTIGTGIDLGESNLFDMDNLQFDKIIICTDADVDGFQIRVLLYTMFYRLMPELLKTGHVYIAETPLFELETSKGSIFAYTVDEKDSLLKSLPEQGISIKHINRSKGLGENTPAMMRQTTMMPETRRLIQLNIDIQDEIVRELSTILFGNDYGNNRKEYIKELMGVQLSELVDEIETLTPEDRNMEDLGEEY